MKFPRLIPRFSRRLLIAPPIAVGVAVLALAASSRHGPQQKPVEEQARILTVTTIQRREIQPQVVGYGLAQPAQTWRAVARVAGTVLETHPNLNAGALVAQGAALVRIDPTDYELQIAQLKAETDALRAQIAETEASRGNDQATLALEEQSLVLSRQELVRQKRLFEQRAASASAMEQGEREMLLQQRSVQSLRNSLNLIPSKLARLRANLDAVEQQLASARRDLERTVIKAPFDCRLASVSIETGQYVAANEQLFEVHGVDSMEVEARLPIDDLHKLVPAGNAASSAGTQTIEQVFYGLSATVRIRSGDYSREWPAELVRIREQVDPRTRTLGVVVEIKYDERSQQPGYPPLLEGTFCEVEFAGPARSGQLLVPIAAVRNHTLFIVNDRERLERRSVDIVVAVGDDVVVTGDLQPGELVVLGDPSPAVEGMLVKTVRATTTPDRQLAATTRRKP